MIRPSRGPHLDQRQHSQKLRTPVQRQLQSGEGTWQQHQNSRLQRQHLNGTHYRHEDYTDRTGCR